MRKSSSRRSREQLLALAKLAKFAAAGLPTNLRNVQLASFFRLYFCCLLDQDLKGQCRQKNWAVIRWFLPYFKEKENCTAA